MNTQKDPILQCIFYRFFNDDNDAFNNNFDAFNKIKTIDIITQIKHKKKLKSPKMHRQPTSITLPFPFPYQKVPHGDPTPSPPVASSRSVGHEKRDGVPLRRTCRPRPDPPCTGGPFATIARRIPRHYYFVFSA